MISVLVGWDMTSICVVHLVRAANGIEPFARFLASYDQSDREPEHELLILFKGFDTQPAGKEGLECYRSLLASRPYRSLAVPDVGFDIMPYFTAVRAFEYDYFCFLNSFSVILDPQWLTKLYTHAVRPGIGVVGASGNWYSRVPPLARERARLQARPYWRSLPGYIRLNTLILCCVPFPNYHIRTNAFMIRRELALGLRGTATRTKRLAYRFEHGRSSLTRQLLARGLEPLIVGRDGRSYAKEEWGNSNIFWQGDQSNLLVTDNRAQDYAEGTPERRHILWQLAWQGEAIPPTPVCSESGVRF
jgi:hypothetical protein